MIRHHLILRVITKLLIGPIMLFALYVQFHGDFGPGGGFQAGVIFASAFILQSLIIGVAEARRVARSALVRSLLAFGGILYIGVGFAAVAMGGNFLDYDALDPHDPVHGQHLGILLIELGVGITVATAMITIFFTFAGYEPLPSEPAPDPNREAPEREDLAQAVPPHEGRR